MRPKRLGRHPYDYNRVCAGVKSSEQILEPLTMPTWFDRQVWRL